MYKSMLPVCVLFVLVTVCSGCGGGGGGQSNPPPAQNSPFAGQWQGTWQGIGVAANEHGTLNVNVTAGGVITGTSTSAGAGGRVGALSGTIGNAGNFNMTAVYGDGTTTITGQLVLNGNNATGNMTQTIPGLGVYQGTINLTR